MKKMIYKFGANPALEVDVLHTDGEYSWIKLTGHVSGYIIRNDNLSEIPIKVNDKVNIAGNGTGHKGEVLCIYKELAWVKWPNCDGPQTYNLEGLVKCDS